MKPVASIAFIVVIEARAPAVLANCSRSRGFTLATPLLVKPELDCGGCATRFAIATRLPSDGAVRSKSGRTDFDPERNVRRATKRFELEAAPVAEQIEKPTGQRGEIHHAASSAGNHS